MYFFFEPELVIWQDDVIHAVLLEEPPLELALRWWDNGFLQSSYEFLFSIQAGAPLLDNNYTGPLFHLYSSKLIKILRELRISLESFPVKIFDRATDRELDLNYKVVRFTEINSCLDEDNSTYEYLSIRKRQIKMLARPVYTDSFLKSNILLTRIAGFERDVIIHQKLKKTLEDEGITGCNYAVEQFNWSAIFE